MTVANRFDLSGLHRLLALPDVREGLARLRDLRERVRARVRERLPQIGCRAFHAGEPLAVGLRRGLRGLVALRKRRGGGLHVLQAALELVARGGDLADLGAESADQAPELFRRQRGEKLLLPRAHLGDRRVGPRALVA